MVRAEIPFPMNRLRSSLVALASLGALASLPAAVVTADFNDLALGELRANQKNNQPANTGTGFGAPHWMSDTGIPRIVAGDLAPPASTNYAIKQTGPARSFQSLSYTIDNDTDRRQGRPLAEPLTGTVWISFLVKNADATQAAGLDFNVRPVAFSVPTATRIVVEGSTLRVFNAGGVKAAEVADAVPLGQAALVLVRVDLGGSEVNPKNEHMRIWVNPVLKADPAALGAPTANMRDTGFIGANKAVTSLGLQSYSTKTGSGQVGGILDSVRLADGPDAYATVTGVK